MKTGIDVMVIVLLILAFIIGNREGEMNLRKSNILLWTVIVIEALETLILKL